MILEFRFYFLQKNPHVTPKWNWQWNWNKKEELLFFVSVFSKQHCNRLTVCGSAQFKWIGKLPDCLRQHLWTKSLKMSMVTWNTGSVDRFLPRFSESLFRSQFYPRVCVSCVLCQRDTVGIGRGWRCFYHSLSGLVPRSHGRDSLERLSPTGVYIQ